MTDRPFTFDYDPASAVLRVRLAGRWTMATLDEYRVALPRMVATGPAGPFRRLLIDLRALEVQPREVADGMQQVIAAAHDAAHGALRVAIVQPASMLTHLQARRVTDGDAGSYLSGSEEDALARLARD